MDTKKVTETIAARLRAERAAANLTQTEVATRTGISLRTIQRYETGEREIPVTTIYLLSGAIGFDIARFMQDINDRLQ